MLHEVSSLKRENSYQLSRQNYSTQLYSHSGGSRPENKDKKNAQKGLCMLLQQVPLTSSLGDLIVDTHIAFLTLRAASRYTLRYSHRTKLSHTFAFLEIEGCP